MLIKLKRKGEKKNKRGFWGFFSGPKSPYGSYGSSLAEGWLAPGSLQYSLRAMFFPISVGFAPFLGRFMGFGAPDLIKGGL